MTCPGAIAAMKLALDAGSGQGEARGLDPRAARQALLVGRQTRAPPPREYRARAPCLPRLPYALDALARVEAARGRLAPRSRWSSEPSTGSRCRSTSASSATSTAPPGDRGRARSQYALIGVIERLLVANGVKTDLETALFDVDHGIRLRHALALARRARAERPSIDGDDVLAWALARNGHCGEALALLEARAPARARRTRSSSSTAG